MSRYNNPQPQYFDDEGNVLSGGKLYFYDAGTVSPRNTYSDSALTVVNTNPVILDADGRLSVSVFLLGAYKVRLTNSDDVLIWEKDPVGSAASGITSFNDWDSSTTYEANNIVEYNLKFYLSKTNGNINNNPETEAADWAQVRLIQVDEGDYSAGATLTRVELLNFASEAQVLAGTITDQPVAPDTLQAKFDTLATVASTGAYSDLSGTPTLATVATTGDYNDLINTPTIPSSTLTILTPASGVITNDYDIYISTSNVTLFLTSDLTIGKPVVLINGSAANTLTLSANISTRSLNGQSITTTKTCTIDNYQSAVLLRASTTVYYITGARTDVS